MAFTNEATWDRLIRIVLAVALGYVAWVTWPTTTGIVSLVIGAIALVTGLVGWCAAYALFGLSTKKRARA